MDNYGEKLVYWYLRLNGFFPIRNFVIHESSRRGETDFLAIKPANAREIVDGVELEFDDKLLESVEMTEEDYLSKNLFVIAEVSLLSKKVSEEVIRKKFSKDIIKYNLQRLGIDGEKDVDEIFNLSCLKKERYAVAKLFFLEANLTSKVAIVIPFSDAETFVEERMGAPFKKSDWNHFPSNVQGIIIRKRREEKKIKNNNSEIVI